MKILSRFFLIAGIALIVLDIISIIVSGWGLGAGLNGERQMVVLLVYHMQLPIGVLFIVFSLLIRYRMRKMEERKKNEIAMQDAF